MSARRFVGAALVSAAMFTGLGAPLSHAEPSPYDQSTFPCAEDEVLGYHPRFGPDHVGCIHIDELWPTAHGVAAADGGVPGP